MAMNIICTDHLGYDFPSMRQMCVYWKIPITVYRNRMKQNWSQKDALTTPTEQNTKICEDHLGNTFNSITEMCEHYDITTKVFQTRISRNWTLKDALTSKRKTQRTACTLHVTSDGSVTVCSDACATVMLVHNRHVSNN